MANRYPAPRLFDLWFYWVSKTPFSEQFSEVENIVSYRNSEVYVKLFGIFKIKKLHLNMSKNTILVVKIFNIPILKIKKNRKYY